MACRVGIVGLGTVGGGVAELLLDRAEELRARTGGVPIELKVVSDLRPENLAPFAARGVETTREAAKVIANPDIDVLVELVGGTGFAYQLVTEAMATGKSVVTANKALLAHAGAEIVKIALERGVSLGFEASVCGGVPVLGALRTGLAANEVASVTGIVNGTCNYILSRMTREGASYADVLADAQSHGYAEADPTFDVEGVDSAHKLTILASLAFRAPVAFESVRTQGISGLDVADIGYAEEFGYVIKLLAIARRRGKAAELSVHPALLPEGHPMAAVHDVFNAVEIDCHAADKVMFYGRGAGRHPTASAVVADLVEIARGTAPAATRDLAFWAENPPLEILPAGDAFHRYYVRFSVKEEYGVLGAISAILGRHRVSIASVVQKERPQQSLDEVPIIILTHDAREADFLAALEEIGALAYVSRKIVFLRVES